MGVVSRNHLFAPGLSPGWSVKRVVCGCADRAGRKTARRMAERVEPACMATSGRTTPRRMATQEGLARMATRRGRMATREGLARMATLGRRMSTWGGLARMAPRGGRMATRGLAEGALRTGTGAAVHGEPPSCLSRVDWSLSHLARLRPRDIHFWRV